MGTGGRNVKNLAGNNGLSWGPEKESLNGVLGNEVGTISNIPALPFLYPTCFKPLYRPQFTSGKLLVLRKYGY